MRHTLLSAAAAVTVGVSFGGCALVIGADFGDKTVRGAGGQSAASSSTTSGAATSTSSGSSGATSSGATSASSSSSGNGGGPSTSSTTTASSSASSASGLPSPCTTSHTFCDDFDHDAGFGKWSGTSMIMPASLAIVTDTAVSSPASMRSLAPSDAKQAASATQLLASPIKSVHCELDVRHDTVDGGDGNAEIFSLAFPDFRFVFGLGTGPSFAVCASNCNPKGFAEPVAGTWRHFALDLDVPTATGTLSVGPIGGAVSSLGNVSATFDAGVGTDAGATLTVGINTPVNLAGPLDVHIDNVFCDVTP